MTFSENISLQKYVDSANQKFSEIESRLSQIEGSFQTRMNGKTYGDLVGAIFGTVGWLIAFGAFCVYTSRYVNSILSFICLGVALALIIVLFIDEIIDFSYYEKILSYKDNIMQLKNRVDVGRSFIKPSQDAFMKSRAAGWRHSLSVGTSILEEATIIENKVNSMEFLKSGFIQSLKNFLYFTLTIAVTGIGSWSLLRTASEIVTSISGEFMDNNIMIPFYVIGLLFTEVNIVILAKMWWSRTDCSVTNTTLLIVPLGPIIFLALVVMATVIIMFISFAIGILIAIGALVIGVACLFSTISGG